MKKFVLSSIVIGSFIMFSLYYRYFGQSTTQLSSASCPPTSGPQQAIIPPLRSDSEDDSLPTRNRAMNPTINSIAIPASNQNTNSNSNSNSNTTPNATPVFKDGTFVGDPADAIYGNIQVQTVIKNGKITDVQFLQSPSDRSQSIEINQYAMPILKSEAIKVQNANVDIVSGATDSSQAFIQSLQTALNRAKI